ncbi:4-hydroxythreonine-4-phosphate dehydrogenase [Tepidicaulis marinus]|uniref:4-hydroxythreonine-4-phosphate dehydrogenase n=1 Tax=Tepidicaulis marinus TaxID=1333998 RepID=A0A081B9F5_9HYPH|nr:4-hydroxythreonine-4-phosphate dehydrogenase PdxA [Tepidicaulis marinus]GAK44673.1 4-hydroxythreonine-4-phosphate dehydrogenase [Tepidicaulis marinus]
MLPLALTMGDPAGIGGELTLKSWLARKSAALPVFFALDDPARLAALGAQLGLDVPVKEIAAPEEAASIFGTALPVIPVQLSAPPQPGTPDPANAPGTIGAIEEAAALAMAGRAGAVVTNPIHKGVLYAAGFKHPGHTEFLAALTGGTPVMMLASPLLKVVPLTIHIALAAVPAALSRGLIEEKARIVHRALQQSFGLAAPRLAAAGLNPHAGEGGSMGTEEEEIIQPALETLRGEGIDIKGPLSADTMFHAKARETYDAALCMYHDQALIPIKTLDFDRGVNVTLGLPIIRTSPDHGTAFDIAGKGVANPASLIEALRLAGEMAARRSGPK